MNDLFLELIKKEAKDPEQRRKLLIQALEYLQENVCTSTAMRGVFKILDIIAENGCPPASGKWPRNSRRTCTDARHSMPCTYDDCAACMEEGCVPPITDAAKAVKRVFDCGCIAMTNGVLILQCAVHKDSST